MNEERARLLANAIMAAAGLAAAYVIVRTPPLRRAAWQLAVATLTSTIPVWLSREVQHAWAESDRHRL